MADVALAAKGTSGDPLDYTIPGAQEIVIKAARASFDGSAAMSVYVPTLRILDPNGNELAACPVSQSVAAGASADVSWFPRGGVSTSGGGGGGGTQIAVPLDTPDSASNGYPALTLANGFVNVKRILPAFTAGQNGSWQGAVRVPPNFASAPVILLSFVANATSGSLRTVVSTAVVAAGASEDTAYAAEAAVDTSVPGTALDRFDVSVALGTTLAPGATLNVLVARNGANAADTLAADALLWDCTLQYAA